MFFKSFIIILLFSPSFPSFAGLIDAAVYGQVPRSLPTLGHRRDSDIEAARLRFMGIPTKPPTAPVLEPTPSPEDATTAVPTTGLSPSVDVVEHAQAVEHTNASTQTDEQQQLPPPPPLDLCTFPCIAVAPECRAEEPQANTG